MVEKNNKGNNTEDFEKNGFKILTKNKITNNNKTGAKKNKVCNLNQNAQSIFY